METSTDPRWVPWPTFIHVINLTELVMWYYYRPQTKLREDNVFTPVCQSFCSQGGWCTPPRQTPPTGQTPPPRGNTPLEVATEVGRGGMHPTGMHSCWSILQYKCVTQMGASNPEGTGVLFCKMFAKNCMKMKEIRSREYISLAPLPVSAKVIGLHKSSEL